MDYDKIILLDQDGVKIYSTEMILSDISVNETLHGHVFRFDDVDSNTNFLLTDKPAKIIAPGTLVKGATMENQFVKLDNKDCDTTEVK